MYTTARSSLRAMLDNKTCEISYGGFAKVYATYSFITESVPNHGEETEHIYNGIVTV